jgi:hypothetical protein
MSRSDYRTLLNRGRKAGLNTRDLYCALSSRAPEAQDASGRAADDNGFVPVYTARGQRVYRPLSGK